MKRLSAETVCVVAISLLICLSSRVEAALVYSQSFEAPVVTELVSAGPAGFVQPTNSAGGSNWQIQGGGGDAGVSLTGGVDNNGVGGSQGLFAIWDHTPAAPGFFTFNQYTVYGLPGFSAGTPLNGVTISMDIYMEGSETADDPINVIFQGNGGGANRTFTPTLANGAFTSVSFTLDEAAGDVPDLTQGYNLRVEHGAGGFGFDAGNVIRIDNVMIDVVPEPSTLALVGLVGLSLLAYRRGK